ncbi:hypothetical protein QZH41_010029 [Actinostola sp. cb2023]|nr:hypothetical protein QZH41_010029 [Actinostola sp. cb2023]
MDSINIKSSDYNRELIKVESHPQNDEINVNDGSVDNNINCVGGKPFKCSSSREELQSDGLDCCGNVVSIKTGTESDWVEKHCKSGELLYHYNKVNINYAHLEGLELADYDNCDNGDGIDILIGADQYWNFVTGDIVRGDDGPTAISSKLGWLLSGCLESSGDENKHTVTNLIIAGERFDNSITENDNDTLNSSLKRFWDVETIGIAPIDEENQGKPNFIQDISFNGDRYEVGLPWKEDRRDIETDYNLCHNRLRSLHSKLRKQPELLQEYDRNIQEQLASGIIERVPIRKNIDSKDSTNEIIDDNNSYNNEVTEVSTRQRNEGFNDDSPNDIHYIPHHGVVRKDRSTTKLRVVYDGSATTTTRKYSLNDCLLTGPNYIPHLFDMMVKFRIHPVALVADIEKAFLMVGINERDRDMLRFLWFANAKEPDPDIVELRFCRLVFGLRPSPAIWCYN